MRKDTDPRQDIIPQTILEHNRDGNIRRALPYMGAELPIGNVDPNPILAQIRNFQPLPGGKIPRKGK